MFCRRKNVIAKEYCYAALEFYRNTYAISLRQAVNQAVEHLQEHSATFSKEQLIQTIEQQHPAIFGISAIRQYLSKPTTHLYYNALSKTYTTATHLANEQTLIRTMLQTRNSQSQFMSLEKQQRQLT